jgi:hypothetical protein
MKSVYFVKGSSDEPYEIAFLKEGDALRVSCDCKAGQNNTLCKHRLGLLAGASDNVDLHKSSSLDDIKKMLEGSVLVDVYQKYLDTCHELERIKKIHSIQKKALARIMKSGV